MRKTNKYQNENQLKLDFQTDRDSFSKKEKGLNSKTQSEGVSKTGIKKAVHTAQSKHLSTKPSKSKLKKACSDKKPSGLLFDNLITIEELAVIFRLAPQTIRNWIVLGKIPYVRIGRRSFFQQRSLQKWLNQKEKPQWQ